MSDEQEQYRLRKDNLRNIPMLSVIFAGADSKDPPENATKAFEVAKEFFDTLFDAEGQNLQKGDIPTPLTLVYSNITVPEQPMKIGEVVKKLSIGGTSSPITGSNIALALQEHFRISGMALMALEHLDVDSVISDSIEDMPFRTIVVTPQF